MTVSALWESSLEAAFSFCQATFQGMISEELTGLSPSQEVLQGWTTVENARAWASLSAEVLREFLGPPGNRDISNLPLAGAVDSATVRRTILEVRMPVAADAAASEGTDDPAEAPPPLGVWRLGEGPSPVLGVATLPQQVR